MQIMNKKLILASGSPRRAQILHDAGFEFDVIVSDIDETLNPDDCATQVERLALQKALAVQDIAGNDAIIIAADTLVQINGKILEKPQDASQAYEMLSQLSGQVHEVFTGVAILYANTQINFAEKTQVHFRKLEPNEINAYIATNEPFDKAGAYGIQGRGATLVHRIEGCYYNVMGLPIARLCQALAKIKPL